MKTEEVVGKSKGERQEEDGDSEQDCVSSVEGEFANLALTPGKKASEKEVDTTDESLGVPTSQGEKDARRLPDDMIDRFCDKLQKATGNRIEGMLAMQYITLEPAELKKHISGKRQVLQVLFDRDRDHYVVVEWDVGCRMAILYDSLPTKLHNSDDGATPLLSSSITEQIVHLFGHLYEKKGRISLVIHTGTATQTDGWSCGYRALAIVCLRARKKNVGRYSTVVPKVDRLVKHIDRTEKPTLDDFNRFEISRREIEESCDNPYVGCYVKLDGQVEPMQETSSSDSEDESTCSGSSTNGSSSSFTSETEDSEPDSSPE
uniref:ULP_PROTEASE domain-containing protein n=1 Tax=Steinernema glaseri TaxID=37863 RepID=A0A1I7ZUY4_9BILA